MSVWIGNVTESQGWPSVLGQLFAPAPLRSDLDILNAWIDALLAFLQPYSTGTITTDEPHTYRTTPPERDALTEALHDNRVNRLVFEVADPNMPREYQGVRYNGPHVVVYFDSTQEREAIGFSIILAPLLSPYQATLVTHLPALLNEWIPQLKAYRAYVTGGNTGSDTQPVLDFHDWTTVPLSNALWGQNDVSNALTGYAVTLPRSGMWADRNRLTLPVRLLENVQYRENGFIVLRDKDDPTGAMEFKLHFDQELTDEDFVTARVAVNGWEDEFYGRFDDNYYAPSLPVRSETVISWWVLASVGFGQHDAEEERSSNGVDGRALRELQDWLLLLPNVHVRELVIG